MANASKDTIYIDIDDEITSIIEKVKNSDKKIVALVLPKRASVLQSVVNMKLLKRSADDAGKSLVLITSETGLLPLAGVTGIHVAKTLQSKPEIPAAPALVDAAAADIDESELDDVELDANVPVGDLASDEAIEVDNDPKPAVAAAGATKATKKAKTKGDKKLKVPNFDKFRLKLVIIAGVIALLVVLWFVATRVMPKATVVVKTEVTKVNVNVDFIASPSAKEVNLDEKILPAKTQESKKTESTKVAATGEVNKGTKATGTVTLSVNCSSGAPTIPAGTGVSTNNLTYITNTSTTIASFPDTSGGGCKFSADVDVTAQNAGDQYNIGTGKTFTVAGYSSVTGTNSDSMTGGTSNIVKVVTQQDIDSAAAKNQEKSGAVKEELQASLEAAGYYALTETFNNTPPAVTSNPAVNAEATEVTVTSVSTYTMQGVKNDDLKALIAKQAESEIDTSKQVILDDGLDKAVTNVKSIQPNGNIDVTLKTTVTAGVQQDEAAIKQEVAGKKKGEAVSTVKQRPGVTDAQISYSPFWVAVTPTNTSKITVVFEQQNQSDNESN